jgi:hypothetical protein
MKKIAATDFASLNNGQFKMYEHKLYFVGYILSKVVRQHIILLMIMCQPKDVVDPDLV